MVGPDLSLQPGPTGLDLGLVVDAGLAGVEVKVFLYLLEAQSAAGAVSRLESGHDVHLPTRASR